MNKEIGMRTAAFELRRFSERLGVCTVQIYDQQTAQMGFHIDTRDAKKSQEKKIAKEAKRLGVKIYVTDKGASFF